MFHYNKGNPSSKRFSPRITLQNTTLFYLTFIVFLFIGGILLFCNIIIAAFILISATMVLGLMIAQTFAFGTYYEIDSKGIYAKRMLLDKFFKFEEISNLTIVNQPELDSVFSYSLSDTPEKVITGHIMDSFNERIELGETTRFCSVNIIFSEEKSGKSQKIKAPDSLILLTTFAGERFILSPKDSDMFISTFRKLQNDSS